MIRFSQLLGLISLFFVFAPTSAVAAVNEGYFASKVFDAGKNIDFTSIVWTETLPASTNIAMEFRAGDTDPLVSSWSSVTNGANLSSFNTNRFFQYRAKLMSDNIDNVPSLNSVVINGGGTNIALLGGNGESDVNLRYDTGVGKASQARTLEWSGEVTTVGQKILYKVRVGNTQAELDSNQYCYGPGTGQAGSGQDIGCSDWSIEGKYFSQIFGQNKSPGSLDSSVPAKRYIEILVRMESIDGDTPVINSVTLRYEALDTPGNGNITLSNTDNRPLINVNGEDLASGVPGGFTNQGSVRINIIGLECTQCGVSTNIRPEVEIKPIDTAFNGDNTVLAESGNNYVDATLLAINTKYHLRVRAIDDQGRVSDWIAYGANPGGDGDIEALPANTDFTVDQQAPTLSSYSIQGNVTASDTYINDSRDKSLARAAISISDNLATTLMVQFSEDNISWGAYSGNPDGSGSNVFSNGWEAGSYKLVTGITGDLVGKNILDAYKLSSNSENVIYIRIRDAAQNMVSNSDTIALDNVSPSAFAISAPSNNTWSTAEANPNIEWESSAGHSEYRLYKNGIIDVDNIASSATTSTLASPLAEGSYSINVFAADLAGNEIPASNGPVAYGYDANLPSMVSNLDATKTDRVNITVSWADDSDSGSPITGYQFERIKVTEIANDWSSAETYTVIDCGNVTSFVENMNGLVGNSCIITIGSGIEESTAYYYRARAKDLAHPASWSPWSETAMGKTIDGKDPSVPTNLSATANTGYQITLSWTASMDDGSGVTGYKIYRKHGSFSDVAGDFKLVGYVDINPPKNKVLSPNNPTVTYVDNDFNNNSLFTDVTIGPVKTTASEKLNDYVEYYYRVTAIDESVNETEIIALDPLNQNNFSYNVVYARTLDITPPSTPIGLVGSALGLDPNSPDPLNPVQKMSLSWSSAIDTRTPVRTPEGNGSGVKQYRIYRSSPYDPNHTNPEVFTPDQGDFTLSGTVLASNTTYQETNLAEYRYYWYRVEAIDNANNAGAKSDSRYIRSYRSTVPTPPQIASVTTLKGDPKTVGVGTTADVVFNGSYSKSAKIARYDLFRSILDPSSVNDETWLSSAENKHTFLPENPNKDDREFSFRYTDTELENSTTYYYRSIATDNTPSEDGGPFVSGLSAVNKGLLNLGGWDITPDNRAPDLPKGLKVKDIHGDGQSYLRNIISWERITTPTRNGENDFSEYRIYRSNDGLLWQQICLNSIGNSCDNNTESDTYNPNPLYNPDKNVAIAENYYIDAIPTSDGNQDYYYYVTAVDDAGYNFRYPAGGNSIVNDISNESSPETNSAGNKVSVFLNPYIAYPQISKYPDGMMSHLSGVGVSSATISWKVDQLTDSVVELRADGETKWVTIGDRLPVNVGDEHIVKLFGLKPNTKYVYKIISRNNLGNEDVIGDAPGELALLPTLITSGFNISSVASESTTTNVTITWNTNIQSEGNYVEYQMQKLPGDNPIGGTGGQDMSPVLDPATQKLRASLSELEIRDNLLMHKVYIGGLKSGRPYSFKIRSVSTDGFVAYSDFSTFSTKSFDSTQFTLAPASSNLAERNITATSAQIVWETAMSSTSWVDYGVTSGLYDNSSGNNDLVSTHVVKLDGLVPGTKYYYRVRVRDANEVEYTSQEYLFTAILKPTISNIAVKDVSPYSIKIAWNTNIDTETIINWGKTTAYGEKKGKSGVSKVHELTIENLEDNTEYHYQILAKDETGNEVADEDKIVRTPLDTEGPKITNAKIDILPMGENDTTSSAIISWQTNKPATTQVVYDEGIVGGKYGNQSTEDVSLNTSHTVIIKDLKPASSYHYRMVSMDKRSNKTESQDFTFVTPTKEKSILQMIIRSLEETFAWTKNLSQFFGNIGKRMTGSK